MMRAPLVKGVGAGMLAVASLSLAACDGPSPSAGVSLEQTVPGTPAEMQALAPPLSPRQAVAVASLPDGAGPAASVRLHAFADGFREDISLKGSAIRSINNGITVLVRTSQRATLDESTPLFKPTEASVRSELSRAFPHVTMQVADRSFSNAYGAYGLALGRAGGSIHCMYAWQWIDAGEFAKNGSWSGPVTVRIKLCKAGTTFDALASLVDHLSLRADGVSDDVAVMNVKPLNEPRMPSQKPSKRRVAHVSTTNPQDHRTAAALPLSVSQPTISSQPFDTDLPPQAFLGPKSHPSTASRP